MSARRLTEARPCWTCGGEHVATRADVVFCSRVCGAKWRARQRAVARRKRRAVVERVARAVRKLERRASA